MAIESKIQTQGTGNDALLNPAILPGVSHLRGARALETGAVIDVPKVMAAPTGIVAAGLLGACSPGATNPDAAQANPVDATKAATTADATATIVVNAAGATKQVEVTPQAPATASVVNTETPNATATATATVEAAKPTATPSFEQWVQTSQPSSSILKVAETAYATATGKTMEGIQTAVEVLQTPNGPLGIIYDSATGTPLLMSSKGNSGEYVWTLCTFKGLDEMMGKRTGVEALSGSGNQKLSIMNVEFNQMHITAMSWKRSQPSAEQTVLEIPQSFMTKALANGETPTFAALVYGNSSDTPDWLKNGNFSREQAIQLMQNHVTTVMKSNRELYNQLKQKNQVKGDVKLQYIVVNEGVNEPGYYWGNKIGPQYIELAFQAARAADPDAVLIYNDFGHELASGPNANGVYDVVANLKGKGLIDAVGMQMHIIGGDNIDPNMPVAAMEKGIRAQIDRYAKLGVPVYVTEADVDISKIAGTPEQKMQKAAEIYQMLFRVFGSSQNFPELSIYGLSSESSWLADLGGQAQLLYTDYKQTPAFFAALTGFVEGIKSAQQ